MCDTLRDFEPFVQIKKREKLPWKSITLSKVAGWTMQLYWKQYFSMVFLRRTAVEQNNFTAYNINLLYLKLLQCQAFKIKIDKLIKLIPNCILGSFIMNKYNQKSKDTFKGTLIQIWKSTNVLVFIWNDMSMISH